MSQYPPQMPGNEAMAFESPRPNGKATASLILGIVSIPLMIACGAGTITAIVGIILGIMALAATKQDGVGGKGKAIAGIVLSGSSFFIGVIALLIAILLPSLGKARELSNRSVCAANLRGITQSMNVYAADNSDAYPIVAGRAGYSLAAGGSGTPGADADTTIKSMYKSPAPSVTQNMWLMVLNGQVAAKQFQCKSDPAPTVTAAVNTGGVYPINFNNGSAPSDYAYSYSVAYPWSPKGIGGWWRNQTDASLPLIADMAPLSGTGNPAATPATGMGSRTGNSFTHQRDGENIGFGDGHAEFTRMPAAGQSNDNIYTSNGGRASPNGTPFMGGSPPPIGDGGTQGAYDVVMVPVADGNANYQRR